MDQGSSDQNQLLVRFESSVARYVVGVNGTVGSKGEVRQPEILAPHVFEFKGWDQSLALYANNL
jgi:hypothetical protein